MASGDAKIVRFLQQECARLQDEKQLLLDEIHALRRYIRALQDLQETVRRFTPENDVLALLNETLVCAMNLLDTTNGSLMLIDEEAGELVFVLVHGAAGESLIGQRFGRHQGIAGWAVEHAEYVIVNNVRADTRFFPEWDRRAGFETRSLIAMPLSARGRVLGVIEVINKRSGEKFTDDDASLLAILASISASALDYAASAEIGF